MRQSLIVLAAIALFSCYDTKKATKQTNRALLNYPAVVATIARNSFPCISLKSDTTITQIDTVVIVDCPDFSETVHDTLRINKTIKVPITLPIRTISVLKIVEDSAKIKILQSIIDTRDATIIKLQATIADSERKIETKNKWIIGLGLSILLSILGFVFKTIIKFK